MAMFNRLFKFIRLRETLFLMVCGSLVLSACSGLKTTPEESVEGPVSVITGKAGGIKLSDLIKKNQPSLNMPVNALLWRAALDVSSFVPLDDVDTFGGSIVTEWHQSADNPDQRLKLTIFIIGLELRSDAVRVRTYTQKKLDNDWVDNGRDDALARKLEDLILTRARELRAASVSETTQ
jgi:hypothetical protein